MAYQWTNNTTATLNVKATNSTTNSYSFPGVNSANSAGTPSDFLTAANNLLAIGGLSAKIDGITRTVKQEGFDYE